MLTISDLVYGQVYTNDEIVEAFGCSSEGGMRRAYKTNTLVIFALHHKSLYTDGWNNDIMHYTGMGRYGNQKVDFAQNKTLAESNTNGVTVHLFEGFKDKEYIYDGIVKLAGDYYTDKELDADSDMRDVIKFPIKLITGTKAVPSNDMLENCKKSVDKIIKSMSDDKLKKAAASAGNKQPRQSSSTTTTYERDGVVAEHTKRRANGICDLCGNTAPFKNKKHEPYLECHHVIRLADNGPDKLYNTVALCPNCHRKIHVLNDKNDHKKLIKKIGEYVNSYGDQIIIDDYKTLFDL